MPGLTIPFAIEATRRNPVRTSVRNLAMSQGDDVSLVIQVFASDGTPVDLSAAAVNVAVQREAWGYPGECGWHDYGLGWLTLADPVVWFGAGAVVAPETGTATVTIPQSVTSNWWGRFRLFIALDGTDAGSVSAEGILEVRRCVVRPRPVFLPSGGGDFASSDFANSDFYTGVGLPDGSTSPGSGSTNPIAVLGQCVLGQMVLGSGSVGNGGATTPSTIVI